MSLRITHDPLKSFLENIDKNEDVIFTGSRRFGMKNNVSEISDWDYVILKEDWKKVGPRIGLIYNDEKKDNYDNEFLFYSCHLLLDDKDYNIIVVDSMLEYRAWKYATNSFLAFIENSRNFEIMKIKENRVNMFEMLKQSFRTFYLCKKEN